MNSICVMLVFDDLHETTSLSIIGIKEYSYNEI